MNIENYIASGILEEFVLDTLSQDERAEVILLAEEHHEIKEEISAIEQSLEIYTLQHETGLPKDLKARIMDSIVEIPSVPPKLNATSSISDYSYWLNSIGAPEFDEMHMEVIQQTEAATTVIAWVRNGEPDHTHSEYTEKFLIVEGACTAIIGGEKNDFGVGDYVEFPINVPHSYIVTSPEPMKVVACLQY